MTPPSTQSSESSESFTAINTSTHSQTQHNTIINKSSTHQHSQHNPTHQHKPSTHQGTPIHHQHSQHNTTHQHKSSTVINTFTSTSTQHINTVIRVIHSHQHINTFTNTFTQHINTSHQYIKARQHLNTSTQSSALTHKH
jgi:hypothetical protein